MVKDDVGYESECHTDIRRETSLSVADKYAYSTKRKYGYGKPANTTEADGTDRIATAAWVTIHSRTARF